MYKIITTQIILFLYFLIQLELETTAALDATPTFTCLKWARTLYFFPWLHKMPGTISSYCLLLSDPSRALITSVHLLHCITIKWNMSQRVYISRGKNYVCNCALSNTVFWSSSSPSFNSFYIHLLYILTNFLPTNQHYVSSLKKPTNRNSSSPIGTTHMPMVWQC